jgi:hypothetical protein
MTSELQDIQILADGTVVVHGDLYVRQDTQLKKGVIWAVGGYEGVIRIRIEYDVPLRPGKANRFNVEMTNVRPDYGDAAVTLERFFITDLFPSDDPRINPVGTVVHETAVQDLRNTRLERDQKHQFSVNVLLPAKASGFYVNVLTKCPSQRFDFHQGYSLSK